MHGFVRGLGETMRSKGWEVRSAPPRSLDFLKTSKGSTLLSIYFRGKLDSKQRGWEWDFCTSFASTRKQSSVGVRGKGAKRADPLQTNAPHRLRQKRAVLRGLYGKKVNKEVRLRARVGGVPLFLIGNLDRL